MATVQAQMDSALAAPARARLWEVDAMRTVAILMMVTYHIVYDVDSLNPGAGLDPFNGGWRALQVTCASTFLALVGTSYWVRDRRLRARGIAGIAAWRLNARRSGQVAAAAGVVSLATYVALGGEDAVKFGILHIIAVAQLLVLPLLVVLKGWNVITGAAAIGGGLLLQGTETTVGVALVLGLDPGSTGVDWVPLLPWIGMPLLGVAIGALLYPDGERHPWLRGLGDGGPVARAAGAPGRRSMTIYLVHQLVLVTLIAAVLTLSGTPIDDL